MPPIPEADGRRARSRRTRRLIVDAATRRFVEDGYLATTIEAVARSAGVAVQTVYYVFGTKPQLLAAVLDTAIAGDDEPVALLARDWVDDLAAAPGPGAAIDALVSSAVAILTRTAPVVHVVRSASSVPEVGELLAENRRRRRADQRRLVEVLATLGHLHVSVDDAADMVYALLDEELFLLLTVDCRWSVDRYRAWLTTVLRTQLRG